ncbi:MAG: ankyrin repeat domain-containing protein, partial [Gammaproteobacteria bacterium]|nr:ankyrin repeat domain-containing protein [Gammaproteobacteria bacterium]
LLDLNIDPNVCDKSGFTPLYTACEKNHIESVVEFLKYEKIQIDLLKGDAESPLFVAARKGFTEIVAKLLERNANPNLARPWDGATPLYMAAQIGNLNIVKLLLEHKADPNQTLTMDGNIVKEYPTGEYPPSPLEIAVKNGHRDIVKLLLSYGARPFEKLECPTYVTQALEKCCAFDAKTDDELKEYYNKFIELDATIQQLIIKTKQFQPKSTCEAIYYSYKDFINGANFNAIFVQLKLFENKLDEMSQNKKIKNMYAEYKIKNHIHLGHILFPPSPIERSKQLIKMEWDSFIEDYSDYQTSPMTKVINQFLEASVTDFRFEESIRAIRSEIRFLTFSKIPNKDSIIENLNDIGFKMYDLYQDVMRNKSSVALNVKSNRR